MEAFLSLPSTDPASAVFVAGALVAATVGLALAVEYVFPYYNGGRHFRWSAYGSARRGVK